MLPLPYKQGSLRRVKVQGSATQGMARFWDITGTSTEGRERGAILRKNPAGYLPPPYDLTCSQARRYCPYRGSSSS
jgi:hypothetical protein